MDLVDTMPGSQPPLFPDLFDLSDQHEQTDSPDAWESLDSWENPTQNFIHLSIPVPATYSEQTFQQTREAARIAQEYLTLFAQKQESYGKGNISDFGEIGVLIRANDKIKRLRQLVYENRTNDLESVEDTWKDLMGYGLIGWMVHRGMW